VLGRLLFAIGAGSVAGACGDSPAAGERDPVSPGPSCASPTQVCLSTEAMQSIARRGYAPTPPDPPRSDAQVAATFDEQGCLLYTWVYSSCCNPASAPGERDGDHCCYQVCDGACCGRALVIAGRTLLAEPAQRSDWLVAGGALTGASHALRPALVPAERARLVELWQADALMEHASIASFARFALQLLALGAPARLVTDAQRAGLEETRHAEHAFSIATRLAGRVIGPDRLPGLEGALETELCAVAEATLVEGCIGETLAAVVALEQARQAGDEAIRATLLEVADDETRHAQLAFRFLSWSLDCGGRELRETLRREVERRLLHLPEPTSTAGVSAASLHHYGRLTADEQRALYRQAYDQILRPSFAALLDRPPARSTRTALHA
jgi:hypothetical protein